MPLDRVSDVCPAENRLQWLFMSRLCSKVTITSTVWEIHSLSSVAFYCFVISTYVFCFLLHKIAFNKLLFVLAMSNKMIHIRQQEWLQYSLCLIDLPDSLRPFMVGQITFLPLLWGHGVLWKQFNNSKYVKNKCYSIYLFLCLKSILICYLVHIYLPPLHLSAWILSVKFILYMLP